MMIDRLDKIIDSTIKKYNMLSAGDRVLVAVSGGADSMLLLNYLYNNRDRYSITVSAAHVEHGIRGDDSIADAEFVKNFCLDKNIQLHCLSINAPEEAKKLKMGVEEYSRKRRYEFFDSIDCDRIATAHNLSDNVETAIFRIIRGSGLKGLCAIPPVRGRIIRPLINVDGGDIRRCCNELSIQYRTDKTNFDNDYSRNFIRNDIIPMMKKINPGLNTAVANMISDAGEDMLFIDNCSLRLYKKALCDRGLCLADLRQVGSAVAKRVIIKYFSDNCVPLDRKHLNLVLELIKNPGRTQIKGSIFAVSNNEFLRIADFSPKKNNFSFVSKILKISEFDKKCVDFYCDCDKIIGTVDIRGRLPGDTVSPAGRGCKKSLKKLFNELKIPPEVRESVPIVADDMGVIGVVGYCVDQRVLVDSKTKNIYCLLKLPSEDR